MPIADNAAVDEVVDRVEAMIKADLIQRMGGATTEELSTMSVADIVIKYLTWRSRFIHPHRRRVHLSRELVSSGKYAEHRPVVDAIARKIEGGDDLIAHLSRGTRTVHMPAAKRRSARGRLDLDRLVAEWGIHHLHLALDVQDNGFVRRSGDLLFGCFATDDAYLIGVFPHGSWALAKIVEICVRDWPDASIFTALNGVVGLAEPCSDEDRLVLRKAGLSTPVEVDGRVWVSSQAGQSTAGTPIWAARDSNVLMHSLNQLRKLDDADLRAAILRTGGEVGGEEPSLATEIDGETYRLRETTTGAVIWQVTVAG